MGGSAWDRAAMAGGFPMSAPEFPVPANERYFEDYVAGTKFEYGPVSLSESDIIEFAKKFDPQDMHVDPGKASLGPFGGLIASGWHTASLAMRLVAENFISTVAVLTPPVVDELRWLKPVRPGDRLWIRVCATESLRTKPGAGTLRVLIEAINQNKEVVMSMATTNLLRCREKLG